MIDGCNNEVNYNAYWVFITAIDGWANNYESNKFNVTIGPSSPSANLNLFGPLYLYENHFIEVELPDYYFIHNNQSMTDFKSSSCIDNAKIKIATRITQVSNKNILFVKVFGNIGWQISIYNTNIYWQISEILVSVNVIKWASKEWSECSGPYESDCISCTVGYVLNSDKSWVRYGNFLPIINIRMYWICGLIAMIVTVFYAVLSLRYGKLMLEPAMHLQTLMMLVLSTDCVNDHWIEYISWIQYFKFDFAFLNFYWFNSLIQWTPSSNRYSNAWIYWQETVMNYFNLILFVLLILIMYAIMKLFKLNKFSQLLQYIEIQPESVLWLCWWIMMPFVWISVYYDLTTYKYHLKLSLFSTLIILLICIYCVLKRLKFISNWVVQKNKPIQQLDLHFFEFDNQNSDCGHLLIANTDVIIPDDDIDLDHAF